MEKCAACHSMVDEGDLFCANCGAEAPHSQPAPVAGSMVATHNFSCTGCGASMSYDAGERALQCPFCASVNLAARPDEKVLEPQAIVPFKVDRAAAEHSMRQWLARSFWSPGDLARAAAIVRLSPVYVPYWVFEAQTHTYWTADTNQTPPGARADWFPLAGEHRGRYAGVLVGASGALTDLETARICPFDLSAAVTPDRVDLKRAIYERFGLPLKHARLRARTSLESNEAQACQRTYVPGSARNVHANVLIEGMRALPVMLPVWIMAYRFRDKVYRFLVNGQTGAATGAAPLSGWKIAAAVAVGAAVVGLLLLLLALAAAG